jgi:hypothetical protein
LNNLEGSNSKKTLSYEACVYACKDHVPRATTIFSILEDPTLKGANSNNVNSNQLHKCVAKGPGVLWSSGDGNPDSSTRIDFRGCCLGRVQYKCKILSFPAWDQNTRKKNVLKACLHQPNGTTDRDDWYNIKLDRKK